MCGENKRLVVPYAMLGIAVLYALSPIDLIPDIPVVGWVDDVTFLIVTSMNVVEKSISDSASWIRKFAHRVKWTIIIIGGSITVLMGLFAAALIKYIAS